MNIVVKKDAPLVLQDPLFVGSDSTIALEDGAEIVAAPGKFLDSNAALIQVVGATNVTIRGKGTIRMRKDDYGKPPYKGSEHRHALTIRGSADVLVEDVTIRDAGGDGVYISDYGRGRTNARITLRRVTCDNGHRQGVSVISAEDLLIEDCDFINTVGGAPEAGIDFEPNYPQDRLVRCVVRNSRLNGNRGAGVDVSFHNLDETTVPVDITIEDCELLDNELTGVVVARNKFNRSPKGLVRFNRCRIRGGRMRGIELLRKVGDGFRVEFNDCLLENVCPNGVADVVCVSRDWSDNPPDNILFNNLTVVQPKVRPWFANLAPGVGPAAVKDFTGTVTVKSPKGEEKIVLDEAWRKATFRDPPPQPPARWPVEGDVRPRRPHYGPPPYCGCPQPQSLAVIPFDACPGRRIKLPAFAHCGETRLVFYADRARKVTFVGQRYWWPGRKREQETRPIEIASIDGSFKASVPIVPFEPTEFSFDVPKAGLYTLHAYCYRNKFILNESDAPVALWPRQGPQRVFCLEQGLKMFLRPKAGPMALLASCKDESVNYTLSDGKGEVLWKAVPHDWTSFVTTAPSDAGLWTLDFGCPKAEAFPTGYSTILDVTGTPGFLFLSKEKTWAVGQAGVLSLNGTWEFSREGGAFEKVEVPHDWAVAASFDPDAPGGSGKLPWKTDGEYRRTFTLDSLPAHARLEFDGVMAWPEVFVNGTKVGGWDFGYMSFACDVTAAVRVGVNEVVVKATTRPHKSRWYPGGGIYRDVRLVTDGKDHIVPGSVFIRATVADDGRAQVTADWTMSESGAQSKTFAVDKPRLWSVEDPHLYTMEIAGQTFRYGIRTIRWTADDGFHLNGCRVQLQGVNLHSDLGPLGMAFDRDAAKRQLLLMKDLGVNAIRTSHNAPDPKFLDLCDEMGFLVWNECFDKWNETAGRKPEQNLEEFVVRNLRQFVRRDRNHPCVICWSISNEISPVGSRYGDANGQTRARNRLFAETVRALDPTRPVTAGLSSPELLKTDIADDLDVQGWNYEHSYAEARERYPKVPLVYSESASAVSSYGFYRCPPTRGKTDFPNDIRQADGYDLTSAWCGDIPDVEFDRVDRDRYLAGEFVWTGIDYLGEPNPFTYIGREDCWPGPSVPESTKPRSSYFGIADLCCIPKDRYYLYRARWNGKSETTHLVPRHWNFASRSTSNLQPQPLIPVFAYTSGDRAELFLNGRSLGVRTKAASVPDYPLAFAGRNPAHGDYATNAYYRVCRKYRLRWDVPYEPGELCVVAYRGDVRVGTDVVRTSGAPVRLALSEDPFTPAGSALAFVQVDAFDAKDVRCATADARFSISTSGDVKVLAVGNADAMSFKSMKDVSHHFLFNGKAVLYIRRGAAGGTVSVSADGLRPADLTVD